MRAAGVRSACPALSSSGRLACSLTLGHGSCSPPLGPGVSRGAKLRWVPRTLCGRTPTGWRYRGIVADHSLRRTATTIPRYHRPFGGMPTERAGHPSSALQRPCIVVRGCGYTTAARRRAAVTGPCSDRPDQRRIRPRHPAKHRVGKAFAFANRTDPRALASSVVCAVTVEVTPIRQLAVRKTLDQ